MPSLFKQIASLITVAELQEPLGGVLAADDDPPSLRDDYRIFLVVHRETRGILGWVEAEVENGEEHAGDVCKPIGLGSLMSSEVTALEALHLFSATDTAIFFVVQKDQITGTLRYEDLFKPVFALCLLALTLELEQEALKVLSVQPSKSWEALPEGRREEAQKAYGRRNHSGKQPTSADLLRCTTFIDKPKMLTKRGLLSVISKSRVRSIFSRAEKVRNRYAHPDEIPETTDRRELIALIQNIEEVLLALSDRVSAERDEDMRELTEAITGGPLNFSQPT